MRPPPRHRQVRRIYQSEPLVVPKAKPRRRPKKVKAKKTDHSKPRHKVIRRRDPWGWARPPYHTARQHCPVLEGWYV